MRINSVSLRTNVKQSISRRKLDCHVGLLGLLATTAILYSTSGSAAEMTHDHGGGVFHMFKLEAEYGTNQHDPIAGWDLDGWIGTDTNKLWLKSEGESADGKLESSEFWAMYSRNISEFWDVQAGVRLDTEPDTTSYLVAGINGLAPYWFETEAHLFVSDEGDLTARLHLENEILITQKLILEPYAEVNLSAQDIHEAEMGQGINDGNIGLQARYEFTRKFAPFVDIHYGRKLGETSSIANKHGEDVDETTLAFGIRLMF
jgi:copper resistance protein B